MKFPIGAFAYAVRRRWGLEVEEKRCQALTVFSVRTIWLDGDLDEDAIEDTLRHEHIHAWEREVGVPRTDEDRANFGATVSAAFDLAWRGQGGLPVILSMPIEGIRPSGEVAERSYLPLTDRVKCGSCQEDLMAGSILGEPVRFHRVAGIYLMLRWFKCPVCKAVQIWDERSSEDGLPLGQFFNPRILSGEVAEKWLAEHAHRFAPHEVG